MHTGTIIEGPSSITYIPGLTPLPIELTCNVTGLPIWIVNGTAYLTINLDDGTLPGHSRTGTNILVNIPVNNTEYVCITLTNDGDETHSDPAYIIIAGEYVRMSMLGSYVHASVLIRHGQMSNMKYNHFGICTHD